MFYSKHVFSCKKFGFLSQQISKAQKNTFRQQSDQSIKMQCTESEGGDQFQISKTNWEKFISEIY